MTPSNKLFFFFVIQTFFFFAVLFQLFLDSLTSIHVISLDTVTQFLNISVYLVATKRNIYFRSYLIESHSAIKVMIQMYKIDYLIIQTNVRWIRCLSFNSSVLHVFGD